MKILVPTCMEREQIAGFLAELSEFSPGCEVFASCTPDSASVNRNLCLDQVQVGETAIMLDDDIRGFYPGWVDDLLMGLSIPNAVMVSARLLNEDGLFGPTCSRCMIPSPEEIVVERGSNCILPTAAIAFVHRGHRFDTRYIGSGFEDNDWCFQYRVADPDAVFVQSNRCRLVHLNLMRQQRGSNWQHNKMLMFKKWGV